MKILFDQGTPVPLRSHLPKGSVSTAFEKGWSNMANGLLLDTAERDGFDLLITTDKNLRYQQNLSTRKIAIIVLMSTSWPQIQKSIPLVQAAFKRVSIGTYEEVQISIDFS